MVGVRIFHADNDRFDSALDDCRGARRGAAKGAAGFKSYVKSGTAKITVVAQGGADGVHFGVWLPRPPMPAFAENFTAVDDERADHGIGCCAAIATLRQAQRAAHAGFLLRRKLSPRCAHARPRSFRTPEKGQPRSWLHRKVANRRPARPARRTSPEHSVHVR